MKKYLMACGVIVLLLAWTVPGFTLVVRVEKSRIWIIADRVPLRTILQKIAHQGIRVRIDPNLNPDITVSLKNQDIQSGLSIILKSVNHVLIWETIGRPPDSPPDSYEPRVAEIQVFEPGKESRMIDLPKKKNRFEIMRNPEDGAFYVKDEILVKLRPKADRFALTRLLKMINGTLRGRDPDAGVYRIRLPDHTDVPEIRKRVETISEVSQAEPNYAYRLPIPAQALYLPESDNDETRGLTTETGKAIIAVLDSGIGSDTGLEDLVVNALNAVDPTDGVTDTLGHGTQMAYVASGMIKPQGVHGDAGSGNPILPIKLFDENGFTSTYSIMQSLQFALENEAAVISLSWGSETRSRFLEETFQKAEAKGLIVVASAGNEPTGRPVYPAAYPSVIGVGALAPDGTRWERSNFGNFVTLYAPGFGSFPVGYKGDPGSYAGTSISAAYTANVVAGYLTAHPGADKQAVMKMISVHAKKTSRKTSPVNGF